MTVVAGKECAQGADVSRWQGRIDWSQFPDEFAIVKATGGDAGLYTDGQFYNNVSGCTKPVGAYHFASHALFPAEKEADFFCDVLLASAWAKLPPERKLPPVLDWEPTKAIANSSQWVLAFLKRVEARTGVRPMIYTGAYVSLDRVPELLNYDLWLAAYTQQPIPCAPWGLNWSIWQYSSTTSVPGIIGNVDRNWATREWLNRVLNNNNQGSEDDMPYTEAQLRAIIRDELVGNDGNLHGVNPFANVQLQTDIKSSAPDGDGFRTVVREELVANDLNDHGINPIANAQLQLDIRGIAGLIKDDDSIDTDALVAMIQGLPEAVVAAIKAAL